MSEGMSDKKSAKIGGRLPPELRTRLNAIEQHYGPSDTTMLSDALTALADYVEQNGAYRRPMRMIFGGVAEGTSEAQRWQLNEDAAGSLEQQVAAAAARVKAEAKKQSSQQNRGEKSIG